MTKTRYQILQRKEFYFNGTEITSYIPYLTPKHEYNPDGLKIKLFKTKTKNKQTKPTKYSQKQCKQYGHKHVYRQFFKQTKYRGCEGNYRYVCFPQKRS